LRISAVEHKFVGLAMLDEINVIHGNFQTTQKKNGENILLHRLIDERSMNWPVKRTYRTSHY
jgi:hypothetical protein